MTRSLSGSRLTRAAGVVGTIAVVAALALMGHRHLSASEFLFVSLVPVGLAARFAGWPGAVVAVWGAVAAAQGAYLGNSPAPYDSVVWGGVYGVLGTSGCLALRSRVRSRTALSLDEPSGAPPTDSQAQQNARRDEAIAILAHELRNPLAPIVTAVALIRSATTAADRDRWGRTIQDQVHLLERLVEDLLDVARIQQSKITVRKVTVDLIDLIGGAAETVRPLMDANRHEFYVGLPTDGPLVVEVDPARIRQVVINLLNNAAKYTNPGGKVWLSLERQAGSAVIRVRDTGIGITAEFLPRVWDLFAQYRSGLDRAGGGIGLGLTLVKRLTELHGGTVVAHSAGPGQGSEFAVTLPRPVLSWKSHRRPPTAPLAAAKPSRVLLVEDNMSYAETLSHFLRASGHKVTVVHDGEAALATAVHFKPDTVVLDIGLPGMDGYEIARRMRDAGVGATIVAVTGCATPENRVSGLSAGIDHYLLKPAPPTAVAALIGSPRPEAGTGIGYERIVKPAEDDSALLAAFRPRIQPEPNATS